jgi:hypothetical protein
MLISNPVKKLKNVKSQKSSSPVNFTVMSKNRKTAYLLHFFVDNVFCKLFEMLQWFRNRRKFCVFIRYPYRSLSQKFVWPFLALFRFEACLARDWE